MNSEYGIPGEDAIMIDLRWREEPEPFLIPVPRVPCVGEMFTGPDDSETLIVTSVHYRYDRGYYFEPSRIIVETEVVDGRA